MTATAEEKGGRLFFSVNMEWVCDLARTQLWDENRPMEKVLELLYSIMEGGGLTDDQRYILAIEILEGRKKIVGINEGKVVKDGLNVRPLGLLLQKKQNKINAFELDRHMDVAPYWYVDSFMGGNSLYNHTKTPTASSRSTVIFARQRVGLNLENPLPPHPLDWGTYLLQDARFAYEVLGGPVQSHAEAMEKMTIYWNVKLQEWKDQGLTWETMNAYQQIVYDRNWLACGRKWNNNDTVYKHPFEDELREKAERNVQLVAGKMKLSNDFDSVEEYTGFVDNQNLDTPGEGYKFHGQPDGSGVFFSNYGWVSPEGVWYSCGFAGHQIKAEKIVEEREDTAAAYEAYRLQQMGEKNFTDDMMKWRFENGLPSLFLSQEGWIMVRDENNVGMACVERGMPVNEDQRDTVKLMARHLQLDYDPFTLVSFDVDGYDD
jgi:hypothetical protein